MAAGAAQQVPTSSVLIRYVAALWAWGLDAAERVWAHDLTARARGLATAAVGAALIPAFATFHADDPSWNASSAAAPRNLLGGLGAVIADLGLQSFGLAAWIAALLTIVLGLQRAAEPHPALSRAVLRRRALAGTLGVILLSAVLAAPKPPALWPLARGLGGLWGETQLAGFANLLALAHAPHPHVIAAVALGLVAALLIVFAIGVGPAEVRGGFAAVFAPRTRPARPAAEPVKPATRRPARVKPAAPGPVVADEDDAGDDAPPFDVADEPRVLAGAPPKPKTSDREARESQKAFDFVQPEGFRLPELAMLTKPAPRQSTVDEASLKANARLLEGVLAEFGVRGQIDQIRPGPVVTLYELVPAPGVKSARVVALSDDIARSMSARACRVSVVQGRNAIGIELPNARRETVYLRDLLSSQEFERGSHNLPMALGENIGGEPYVADLGKMPHLLIAGTTGSGKSVGVNAMILSILYRLPPDKCRFIMIDPKMLELSVYDGIPHLLAPVVTDPKKAIVALKWTVREMEDRYRRMSKIGVRNIAGYNEKANEALAKGEHFERTVQTGFNEQGRPVYESEKIRPEPMPYIVVIIDEVADLMLVAGKDIEGAVQRLAQMARAAGIHLIMATQRPSVDVITGTIKANFPTRISFQVTSKIDARTILGEQGAEQLLGQGDMLYMAGGGRITRLHGPFVSDGEVEAVANYLRDQGEPQYLEEVTAGGDEDEDGAGGDDMGGGGGSGDDLYDRAVAVVTRDRKASTSYVQRRLQIGYNRAASLIERMEKEGVVGPANHAGKRDVLAGAPPI
jgi:S-DNA-T family DNA segregation ATPase FtsK/SpoIIIE